MAQLAQRLGKALGGIPSETRLLAAVGFRSLIVAGGMYRSGSTLLFNIINNAAKIKWEGQVVSGWIGDVDKLAKGGRVLIIKTHHLPTLVALRARHKFYSFRDIRTVAVSRYRRFNVQPSMKIFDSYVKEYTNAQRRGAVCLKYEDIINDRLGVIQKVINAMAIEPHKSAVVADSIERRIAGIENSSVSDNYSRETLLHEKHRTNTNADEWRDVLPDTLKDDVNAKYDWWFRACGYPAR